jgi:16S rRNA (guanine527-N7)-methyltransferase
VAQQRSDRPPQVTQPPLDAEALARELDVSRETLARLRRYVDLLVRWQRAVNLVGVGTLPDVWRRHILDSAQIHPHLPPSPRSLVDLGSGAGLPGLVLAILGVEGVHLVESDQRKVAFLREAARVTAAPVRIHAGRIEQIEPFVAEVVTARALAPLPRLLELAAPFIGPRTTLIFLKGRTAEDELTDAAKCWHMRTHRIMSRSDPTGVVLKLEDIARASHREPQRAADRPHRRGRQPEGRRRQDDHRD